jgi:hypothetical protein
VDAAVVLGVAMEKKHHVDRQDLHVAGWMELVRFLRGSEAAFPLI